MKIEIDVNSYLNCLDLVKDFRERQNPDWRKIPNSMWEFICDLIRDCGLSGNTDPFIVYDYIAIVNEFGEIDEFIENGETREEAIERMKKEFLFVDEDNDVAWREWR